MSQKAITYGMWKIYYADLSTYSDQDGSWHDAPHRGVVVLASADPDVGRELDHGARGEFFAWWPGASKPWGFDRTGIIDYMVELGYPDSVRLADFSMVDWQIAGVKIGRSVDNNIYQQIMTNVMNDDYLQRKSADTPRERAE